MAPVKNLKPEESKKKWFGLLLVLMSVILTLLVLEGVAQVYHLLKFGRRVPIKDLLRSEENYYTTSFTKMGCVWGDGVIGHPYFAYTYKRAGKCSIKSNSLGLQGDEYPLEKKPGEFVILVAGGSVADIYSMTRLLQIELNKNYTNKKIQKFTVLDGGVGAWHEPQPFLLFMLYADFIDAVITLDGFNEHFNFFPGAQRLEIPALDLKARDAIQGFGNWRRQLGYFFDATLFRWLRDIPLLNHSHLAYILIDKLRGKFRNLGQNGTWVSGSLKLDDELDPFLFPKDWDPKKRQEYNINQYFYYIRAMDAVATKFGVETAHFLQPVPDIDKDLTPEEKSVVRPFGEYKSLYLMLEKRFLALRKESIKAYSLTDIYKDEHDTIYKDYIHPNQHGMEIMNRRIVEVLRSEWKVLRK